MDNVENLGLIAALLTTTAFVPQVYKAWKYKSTKDVSLAMYIVLLIGLILWMIYGFSIQSLPVILANTITLVLVLLMVLLKLRHK